MVGGIVTEVKQLSDRIWVNCVETNCDDKCAIYVERNTKSEQIKAGDSLWWQGGHAMWTPFTVARKKSTAGLRGGVDYDIRIPRIGFSGVCRPLAGT